jgi:hypothetical protein
MPELGVNTAYQYQEQTFKNTIFKWKPAAKILKGKFGNTQYIVIIEIS